MFYKLNHLFEIIDKLAFTYCQKKFLIFVVICNFIFCDRLFSSGDGSILCDNVYD